VHVSCVWYCMGHHFLFQHILIVIQS
jgi:hypothetical protein